MVAKEFVQLEETGPVYILTEAQNINSFENGLKEPTYINFSITKKGSVTSYRPDNRLLIATITPYQHLMGDFKALFVHLALESLNYLVFHISIPEAMAEVTAVAAEGTRV